MSFSLAQLNISLLIPMSILVLGAIVLLGVGVFNKTKSRDLYIAISLLFVIVNLGFLLLEATPSSAFGFFGMLTIDGIPLLAQIIMLATTLLLLLFFMRQNSFAETQKPEFYAFILFALAGFSFMVSSQNLILILLGLETASLSIYALIALHNKQVAFEASIKYFIMGALATALYAFGAMILYATTGSVNLIKISHFLIQHVYEPSILVCTGFVFLLVALGFKVSMVPFHTWVPDVYEGANSLVAAFIAIVPKIAAFVVVISVFGIFLYSHNAFIYYTFYTFVILSITIPNLIALAQKDVKRMLAYSSISHSGFVLAAILIGTQEAYQVVFLYWILFLFANVGAFGILWLSADSKYNHSFKSFSGMIKTNPTLAVFLSLFMFALAGIPPFSVFWGKMYLIMQALSGDYICLALVMILNSAIAGFYYLKLVIYIFAKDSNGVGDHQPPLELSAKIAIAITALVSMGCIFMVQKLLNLISYYL